MGCQKEKPMEEQFDVMSQFYNGFVLSSESEKQTYFEWGHKSSGTKRSSEKSREKTERNISLQVLQQYFPGSLKDAAKSIGVCPTTLKRICRQHGIMRWPSRKIKKVSHSLKKLQLVIDSVQGAEGMIQLGSFYTKFPKLSSAMNSPSPKTMVNDRVNLLKVPTVPSNSSSSCSRGSSSSTGNAKSSGLLQEETKLLVTSENDKLVDINFPSPEVITNNPSHISHEDGVFRVKATYGNEKIRLKILKHWGFEDLQHEIKRRFNIYDMGNIRLEYIDDDSEWVLLACDDDLEECRDLHASTKNQTIKLFLHHGSLSCFTSVCPTTLKRICRQYGIMRWPSRKIKKVSHSLKKLQLVINSFQGAEGMIQLGSFYSKFPELSSAMNSTSPKTMVNVRVNLLKVPTVPSNSSSSCSRGSSSSTGNAKSFGLLQEETKLLVTFENDKLVDINFPSPEVITNNRNHVSQEDGDFKVKGTYGNEKIRFKMLKHWGFEDLQPEIKRRFNIYDMGNIILEYIDDDSEWVLLACDDDLEECRDLHASTKNQTIKLFLHSSFLPMYPSFLPMC